MAMASQTSQSETADLYSRVKSSTDKFFATLREAKSLETQGKTNLVSPSLF